MLPGGAWRTYHVKPWEWTNWAVAASGFQHEVTELNGQVWAGLPGAERLHMRDTSYAVSTSKAAPKAILLDLKRLGRTGTDND